MKKILKEEKRMRTDSYYIEKIIDLYDKMFETPSTYNDTVGTYYFPEIGLLIRKWNYKIEAYDSDINEAHINLLKFILKCEHYWFNEVKE